MEHSKEPGCPGIITVTCDAEWAETRTLSQCTLVGGKVPAFYFRRNCNSGLALPDHDSVDERIRASVQKTFNGEHNDSDNGSIIVIQSSDDEDDNDGSIILIQSSDDEEETPSNRSFSYSSPPATNVASKSSYYVKKAVVSVDKTAAKSSGKRKNDDSEEPARSNRFAYGSTTQFDQSEFDRDCANADRHWKAILDNNVFTKDNGKLGLSVSRTSIFAKGRALNYETLPDKALLATTIAKVKKYGTHQNSYWIHYPGELTGASNGNNNWIKTLVNCLVYMKDNYDNNPINLEHLKLYHQNSNEYKEVAKNIGKVRGLGPAAVLFVEWIVTRDDDDFSDFFKTKKGVYMSKEYADFRKERNASK
jgi:hypothetical protein